MKSSRSCLVGWVGWGRRRERGETRYTETIIPAWISNHMSSKVCDKITYPFPNFNGCTVEAWVWISNFIPHFIIDVMLNSTRTISSDFMDMACVLERFFKELESLVLAHSADSHTQDISYIRVQYLLAEPVAQILLRQPISTSRINEVATCRCKFVENFMRLFLREAVWRTVLKSGNHDDVIKWKHFPRYWPFVRGIHRSPVNSPHKGQWRGALMFSLICVWINGWVNNREAGDLRRYRAHYDFIVMIIKQL